MKYRIKIKSSLVVEVISGLFILLFVYTAISKLFTHEQFTLVLKKSPLLEYFAPYISVGLPILELILAAALFVPRYRQAGLIASTILMTIFTTYLIYMIYFTPHLPCSCGGVLAQLTWRQHLVFNSAFIALGIIGIFLNKNNSSSILNKNNDMLSYSPS